MNPELAPADDLADFVKTALGTVVSFQCTTWVEAAPDCDENDRTEMVLEVGSERAINKYVPLLHYFFRSTNLPDADSRPTFPKTSEISELEKWVGL